MPVTAIPRRRSPGVNHFTGPQLLRMARLLASDPGLPARIDLASAVRQWVEIESSDDLSIWLIAWPAGSATSWHDHGTSGGAFLTVRGALHEETWSSGRVASSVLTAGVGRHFGGRHVHRVSNPRTETAVSVHVYTPRLTGMSRYELSSGRLRLAGVEQEGVDW